MTLDRWIAVFFLVVSIVYGYASFNYPLLPFERNMAFLPNTMPMVLSVISILLCLILILVPRPDSGKKDSGNIDVSALGQYHVGKALALLLAMVLFALTLRPFGFILSTSLFLTGSAMVLGERNFKLLVPIALFGAFFIWYLVQEMLGIFMRPWPGIFS